MTWYLDRLARTGPLLVLVTLALTGALAALVSWQSDVEDVLGIVLLGAVIITLGTMFGSAVTSGLGAVLFSLGVVVAEVPVVMMAIVGIGLFISLIVHDLAGVLHRAPQFSASLVRTSGTTAVIISALTAGLFAVAYPLATATTWNAIVAPFGIAAIGLAAKLAADSHFSAARALTKKRPAPEGDSGTS